MEESVFLEWGDFSSMSALKQMFLSGFVLLLHIFTGLFTISFSKNLNSLSSLPELEKTLLAAARIGSWRYKSTRKEKNTSNVLRYVYNYTEIQISCKS